MIENSEILNKFKAFKSRSTEGFSSLNERIKQERKFVSGDQWSKNDDKYFSRTRNRITLNVIGNQCHSVANQYAAFPYTWFTNNENIDKEVDQFFATDANQFAVDEALLDQVSHGRGVMALGSDTDPNGKEVPVLYSITDPDRVLLDPDSVDLDGSDAMEGALIDYRSREWVRVHMGEEYVPGKREKMICASASCSTLIPIITYYWLDTDGCHVTTFVNEKEVTKQDEDGNEVSATYVLPLHRIPIFPVWGERTWEDNKETYTGLISKSEAVQRIVNYAMTQLCERLALSPKPMWKGYIESFKDLDKYYKRAGTGENTIIPGQRLANDNTTQLPLPERVDNTVQFADVQGIVQGTLGMMTSITGVDSKGLADTESDVTATAVMYTAKVFQNNIRHFFSHLRTTFKSIGDCVMVLLGHPDVHVEVTQGPDAYAENQVARQELAALMGVAEPNQKRAIINAILKTHPDNDILAQLYGDLNAMQAPTPMEAQAMETIETMKKAIEGKDAEIMQLTAQVETLTKQRENQDKSYVFELKKMELQHRFEMEKLALQAQISNTPADVAKAAAEADKARLDAEKSAVELDKAKTEAVSKQAEIVNNMFNPEF